MGGCFIMIAAMLVVKLVQCHVRTVNGMLETRSFLELQFSSTFWGTTSQQDAE